MKKVLFVLLVVVSASAAFGQKYHPKVQAVRDVVEKWNMGYRAMDPKAMSATIADELDFVNRFGQRLTIYSRDEYEKIWAHAFTSIYKGKPGPEHDVQTVRFITEDVVIVHSTEIRTEPVITSDGKKIPPFTEQATFVLVKKNDEWRITAHNMNNQFADPDKTENLPGQNSK
jgi:uncharacterized protein (TIGR02246 family)